MANIIRTREICQRKQIVPSKNKYLLMYVDYSHNELVFVLCKI